MTIQKSIISILLLMFSYNMISQENKLENSNEKLIEFTRMILNGKNDSIRAEANKQLKEYLISVINTNKSYLYEFENTEHIYILQPKNKKFKIFTWFLPYLDGTFNYFGIIQQCNKRGRKCTTYLLEDKEELKQSSVKTSLNYNEWYGCVYYDIIPVKIGKEKYYTLLGWDGNNLKTSKKIIDVLRIKKKKNPVFGANIFNNNTQRIIIEYSSQYPISLQYDKKLEYIVFDHLEPIDGVSTNNFSIYATNLSYDIFKKNEFGWKLEKNIYLNNLK